MCLLLYVKYFQVVIEVGHKAQRLKEPIGEFLYKWNLFLRSADERQHLDKLVSKVVFNLHETFKEPCRVCTVPPYCVREHGYGEFEFPIDIYFNGTKNGTESKYRIQYFLELPMQDSNAPIVRLRKQFITFQNPDADFRRLLIESGAVQQPPGSVVVPQTLATSTTAVGRLSPHSNIPNHHSNTNLIGTKLKIKSQKLILSL